MRALADGARLPGTDPLVRVPSRRERHDMTVTVVRFDGSAPSA